MFFRGRIRIAPRPVRSESEPLGDGSTDLILRDLAAEYEQDRKRMRWVVLVAAVLHVVLLLVTFPDLTAKPKTVAPRDVKVYVVQQIRFKQPMPRPQQARPKKAVKKIPIPDPTPDDPEPLLVEDLPEPELEIPGDDLIFGIPDAPSAGSGLDGWDDALEVGGGVTAPVKIFYPQPRYTEEARKARIQGMVILRAVIDAEGNVAAAEAMKDLSMGLTESAIETVSTWKFKPATLRGEPVPVFYLISVHFRLL